MWSVGISKTYNFATMYSQCLAIFLAQTLDESYFHVCMHLKIPQNHGQQQSDWHLAQHEIPWKSFGHFGNFGHFGYYGH